MIAVSSLFDFRSNWNIIFLIIGALSLIGMTVFIERLFYLNRSEIDTVKLMMTLRKSIREGNLIDALRICEETGGPIASIVKAGLSKHNRSKEDIQHAMEISGIVEIAKLEQNAKVLSIIASIAPLIGLLGTVLGFIQAFSEMRLSGLVDISATRIGEAMEYALITTALGLCIAIPAVIAYNYIVSRIENFVLEIQTSSSEVVDIFMNPEDDFRY